MVRALLDGRKTQTRRLVKPQPVGFFCGQPCSRIVRARDGGVEEFTRIACPYGAAPGDRLWVKETHRIEGWDEDGVVFVSYAADDARRTVRALVDDYDFWVERQCRRLERAGAVLSMHDEDGVVVPLVDDDAEPFWHMPEGRRPPLSVSIHMPRWASRITLEVTDVRVERLQAISEDDAEAEGVGLVLADDMGDQREAMTKAVAKSRRAGFQLLWESINGTGSWAANPWVWAISFKRVEGGAA